MQHGQTEQVSEPETIMEEMLEFLQQQFKIINMLSALMEKVFNIKEQMDNINRKQGNSKKNQNEMPEICKINNVFDDSSTDWIQQRKRISKLEEMSIATSKIQRMKNEQIIKNCRTITKDIINT